MIKLVWVGIGLGATSLAANGYLFSKVLRADNIMDEIVDKTVGEMEIEIPEYMVEQAVNKSVDFHARAAITRVSSEVAREAKAEIKKAVDETIARSKEEVKTSVTLELKRQLKNIDISDMKKEIKEEAREITTEKFKNSLDDILDDFNSNLANVRKIYSSIADSVSEK